MKHRHKTLAGALVVAGLAAALALLVAGSQGVLAQAGSIIYVDIDAAGVNNGSSWRHALNDLQDALDLSDSAAQIWVAEGIYTPTRLLDPGDPRSATFQMVNGVAILGGFDPGTGAVKLGDRDWVAHETILSGNIGDEDLVDDNSYHVWYNSLDVELDNSAVLDGFIIAEGNADQEDPSGLRGCGGGMLSEGAAPALRNITFKNNSAVDGGALFITNGEPDDESSKLTLTNVTFEGNSAVDGGAVYIDAVMTVPPGTVTDTVPIRFTNCIFSGNSAFGDGGAIYISASQVMHGDGITSTNCIFSHNIAERGGAVFITWGEPDEEGDPLQIRFTNCIFWSNDADLGGGVFITDGELDEELPALSLTNCTFSANEAEAGGGIYVGKGLGPGEGWLEVTNSILYGDYHRDTDEIYLEEGVGLPIVTYSDIEGGYEGVGNIDEDPLFADAEEGDLHLQADSPCIDVGSNDAPNLPPFDFEGDDRILDGDVFGAIVDMGADEVKMPAMWVEIDITPSVPSNVIKLGSPRRVPVAILSTDDFDAPADVLYDMVYFAGAPNVGDDIEDVDNDGDDDLILFFRPADMSDLDEDSTEATLTGVTHDKTDFEGTDEVTVIP